MGTDRIVKKSLPLSQRPWTLLTILLVVAGGVAFLLQSKLLGLMPPCMFHKWTGLFCPGCGGRRCVMMLSEGRWLDALRMNALVLALGVGFGGILLRETLRETRGSLKAFVLTPRMGWAIAYGLIGFWVLRNIRCWPFDLLAPVPL
jgi:hypothetical protein